jgi:hypothetical protein
VARFGFFDRVHGERPDGVGQRGVGDLAHFPAPDFFRARGAIWPG